jgi:hypothetical protein
MSDLAAARRSIRALREGTWDTVRADDERGVCMFRRRSSDDECVVTVDLPACDVRLAHSEVEAASACPS